MKIIAAPGFFDSFRYTFRKHLDNVYYFFRDLVFPYNKLKLRALPRHYCDPCTQIIHAMFEPLSRLLEEGDPTKHHMNFNSEDPIFIDQTNTFLEMYRLYNWYWDKYCNWQGDWDEEFYVKFGYLKKEDVVEWGELTTVPCEYGHELKFVYKNEEHERASEEYRHKVNAAEEAWRKEVNDNLHKLVNLIPYMWV